MKRYGLVLLMFVLVCGLAFSGGQTAQEDVQGGVKAVHFKFAASGDILSMDPHQQSETFTNGVAKNVYEGLVEWSPKLELVPVLAERWELINPTTRRFYLRKGVTFHEGESFTADDVLFSVERTLKSGGAAIFFESIKDVKKIDDYTIDIITNVPDPVLMNNLHRLPIMSKSWAEKHDISMDIVYDELIYPSLHANGTGPFMLVERIPDVRTEFEVNPNWWNNDKKTHNLTKVTYTPISNAATRTSALLTGDVDLITQVPLQDLSRIEKNPQTKVLQVPELRIVMLGMDISQDELPDMAGSGKNPLNDVRVRKAIYQAIDIETIKEKIMRGYSRPTGCLLEPGVTGWSEEADKRYPYDPEAAKALLAEAGYPDGFPITLDAPNDRYVNDEAIGQAIVTMLAQIDIDVTLNAQTKSLHFQEVNKGNSSFWLIGFCSENLDGSDRMNNVILDPGYWALSGYDNPKAYELRKKIDIEMDVEKRSEMMKEFYLLMTQDLPYLPLHQQQIIMGARTNVERAPFPFDFLIFNDIRMSN